MVDSVFVGDMPLNLNASLHYITHYIMREIYCRHGIMGTRPSILKRR